MTAYMTKELTLHSQNLKKAFDALDRNNNGMVDIEELKQSLEG